MKQVIILHGMQTKEEYYDPAMPSMSNAHWLPWLQSQLLKHDIPAVTPEIFRSYDPQYEDWAREVERYDIDTDTMLVGHSCGGGFWIKYLSLHPKLRVRKVILVAPWLDPDGDETGEFFDGFSITPDVAGWAGELHLYSSDNDMANVLKSVAAIRDGIPKIIYREFPGYQHFTRGAMKTDAFPELLEELLG